MLIDSEQILTVVSRHQSQYTQEEFKSQLPETIVSQPCARETSAGILLAMLKINQKDPDSIVSMFPSDHFIKEENRFMEFVREANEFVVNNPDSIVLLGVHPDRNESGYGWIETGNKILYDGSKTIYKVRRFWEKPDPENAKILLQNGCLWNTFVLIGKSATFLKYIKLSIPEVFYAFEPIQSALGSSTEEEAIESTFPNIPAINFSRFVLEKIPEHLHVMEISEVYWSDWGEENRIRDDIKKLELCPNVLV
jgi:mannose-1-phosphate guanylyltransferase